MVGSARQGMAYPVGVCSCPDFPHRIVFSIYYAQTLDKRYLIVHLSLSGGHAKWKSIPAQENSGCARSLRLCRHNLRRLCGTRPCSAKCTGVSFENPPNPLYERGNPWPEISLFGNTQKCSRSLSP
jgi:hypothetical protein